jgi:hypothetical protein
MKMTPIFHVTKIACLALAAIGLTAGSSHAQTVIGSWQGIGDDGWIDWGNGLSITDPSNAGKYSFASGVVPGYAQSLQITYAGYSQDLAIKLEYAPGDVAAFLNNHLLSFTFSVPASGGTYTGGWTQLYGFDLNASGYGYNNIPWSSSMWSATGDTGNNQSGMPNYYWWSSAPVRSQTVTLDYSSILPLITATPTSGYIEFNFSTVNGGGAPDYMYMNNVELWGGPVPEPATGVLALTGGVFALFGVRHRSKHNA